MFTIEKKGERLASVDFFETALQVARSHGKGAQVRRTRDGALCARVGRPIDFVGNLIGNDRAPFGPVIPQGWGA